MDLSRNDLLLIDALQICFDAERIDNIRELSELDWNGVVENAIDHGVSPFIWHHIKPFAQALGIPRSVNNKFSNLYLRSVGKGEVIRNQLHSLLQLFEQNGFPVIVVKGAYLADKVYQDFSIRPMTDIDILIKPEDAHSVENTLLASGYGALKSTSEPISSNHYIYKPICNGVRVEVHIDLRSRDNDRSFDINDIWRRSVVATIVGCKARALGLEDLILYQCYHHSKHLFKHFGLRSLCDLALIIKHNAGNINWELLAERSKEWHAENSVYLSMELLNKYFHITASPSFMKSLNPGELRMFTADSFSRDIFNSKNNSIIDESTGEAPRVVDLLNSINNNTLLNRLRLALFPPNKAIIKRYRNEMPSRSILYLYVVNIKRLIVRYFRITFKLLLRNTELVKKIKSETIYQKIQTQKTEWLKI